MKPTRLNWPDSARAEIQEDGSWDLVLPGGKHVRGKTPDSTTASAAATTAHDDWVLTQWAKGRPVRQNQFVVPLT
jgi:hypothetical protein